MRTRGLLLAAALLLSGCGAAAGEPEDAAATTSTPSAGPSGPPGIGYASAFLGAGGSSGSEDLFVHLTVFDPPDVAAFGNGEFFVLGWDCQTAGTVPATVDGTEAATAVGELTLTCGSHTMPGEVTGTAVVDLTWTADGPPVETRVSGPGGECDEDRTDRHAVVGGQVRVTIPELGYDGVATSLADDDDTVAQGVPACG